LTVASVYVHGACLTGFLRVFVFSLGWGVAQGGIWDKDAFHFTMVDECCDDFMDGWLAWSQEVIWLKVIVGHAFHDQICRQ